MALQSHQGTVRIFPVWDRRLDCAYENLRADGAFLVSAEMRAGITLRATAVSEKGGRLSVVYPEKAFSVTVNGKKTALSAGDLRKGIETAPGDAVEFQTIL